MFLIPPAPSRQLHPFLPDRKLPQEQEFTGIGARQPRVFLRQWSYGPRHCQEFRFSSQLDCKLLEYRNLTHLQLLQPCLLQVELSFLHSSSVFTKVFFFSQTLIFICFHLYFRARLQQPVAPKTPLLMWMCLWIQWHLMSASMPSTLSTLPCTAGNR